MRTQEVMCAFKFTFTLHYSCCYNICCFFYPLNMKHLCTFDIMQSQIHLVCTTMSHIYLKGNLHHFHQYTQICENFKAILEKCSLCHAALLQVTSRAPTTLLHTGTMHALTITVYSDWTLQCCFFPSSIEIS